jgi:3-hydroxybutyrate dehydrogenase
MLRGKVALITGSTSGIGLGVATELARSGAHIVLNGFGDSQKIEQIKQSMTTQFGVTVKYSAADMKHPSQIHEMVKMTIEQLGSLDILVNNAGIQHVSPVESFAQDKWDAVIAINLSSSFHTIQAALPHMYQTGWGRIINIASAHGLVASANKSAYVAAKHGLIGLTKTVALEAAKTGVTCNAICPGWVLTPLVQKQIDDIVEKEGITEELAKSRLLSEKQPSGEFVTPQQIGKTIVFLCSDAAQSIRGSSLSIDGGWTAQ